MKKLFFKDFFGVLGTVVELQLPKGLVSIISTIPLSFPSVPTPDFFLKESENLSEEFFVSSIFRVNGADPKRKGRGFSKTPWVEAEPKKIGKKTKRRKNLELFFQMIFRFFTMANHPFLTTIWKNMVFSQPP